MTSYSDFSFYIYDFTGELLFQSWTNENDRMRQKLLALIGKIGRDAKLPKTTSRVSEILPML